MSTVASNEYTYQLMLKKVDFSTDVFKIILLDSTFVFNRVTHEYYADVSANELATLNGYTNGGATLSGIALTRNDILNLTQAAWSDISWNIVGGNITSNGAIILDTSVAGSLIIGYIDFGGTQVTYAGGVAKIAAPTIVNAG